MCLKQNTHGLVIGKVNWNFIFLTKIILPWIGKTEFQNQLQIADYQNWAAALYFSYNFVSESDEADEIEYKYLNKFYGSDVGFISNFIFEKQVGKTARGSTTFSLSNYIFLQRNFFGCDFWYFGF